jgi:glycosyltransferase involved in cell wall biosynthesis
VQMNRRFSIVYISTGLEGGGAEMMLYQLLAHINLDLFQVSVVSLIEPGVLGEKFQAAGIPVYSIGMKRGLPTVPTLWRLIQTIRKLQPDLLQGWMYHGNLAAQIASFLLGNGIPVLWSIHASINPTILANRSRKALIQAGSKFSQFPAQILFVSKSSQQCHEAMGYCAQKCLAIPNGFDTELFCPNPDARAMVRQELGLAPKALLIASFARYHPVKDHPNFLHAAAELHRDYPDVHFILAGENIDSSNHTLQLLIESLKLTERVHLLGARQDVPTLMAGVDIVTSASASEAFPMIVGEAMSCGVPCVVTDVGDSSWIVGDTGRVVPPQDAPALAAAWAKSIESGSEARVALGHAARARIIEHFTLARIVDRYESLYKSVLV